MTIGEKVGGWKKPGNVAQSATLREGVLGRMSVASLSLKAKEFLVAYV